MDTQIGLHKTVHKASKKPVALLPNISLVVKGPDLPVKSRRPRLDFKLPI